MGKRILVVGSSFAGLAAALELKRLVGNRHEVAVRSASDEFLFLPSLIWVPFALRRREDVTFPLAPLFDANGIDFARAEVTGFDLPHRRVETSRGTEEYDYLVIATGARPDFSAVPGMGPRGGHTQSIFSWDDAQTALVAFERFMLNPGPVVIGAVQGASSFSAAYEFLLNMSHQLRKRGPAGRVQLTYLTPEPYVGHFGTGGFGLAAEKVERLLHKLQIDTVTNAVVEKVTPGEIHLASGQTVPFSYSMLAPPLVGTAAVQRATDIADAEGFVKVDEHYRVPKHPEVFAAGMSVSIPSTLDTTVPMGVPKTGYMAEEMGRLVAQNIAADIRNEPLRSMPPAEMRSKYVIDGGDTGFILSFDKHINPEKNPMMLPGPEAHWAKLAFERYFLATRRRGIV